MQVEIYKNIKNTCKDINFLINTLTYCKKDKPDYKFIFLFLFKISRIHTTLFAFILNDLFVSFSYFFLFFCRMCLCPTRNLNRDLDLDDDLII